MQGVFCLVGHEGGVHNWSQVRQTVARLVA